MHFDTISGCHGGVLYSGVEIRHRTHTLLEFLDTFFTNSLVWQSKKLVLRLTVPGSQSIRKKNGNIDYSRKNPPVTISCCKTFNSTSRFLLDL